MLGAATHMGTSLEHLRRGFILVLLEVLHEQLAELGHLVLEVGGTVPGLGGVEKLIGNVGASLGDREVEGLIDLILLVSELAGVDGVEDGASVLEWATLAAGGSTSTDPASVEQPGIGIVLLDLLRQHPRVAHGVKSQEGLSEARGEGGLGLSHTLLGTGHLGGITRDEVVHGLLGSELGDGRQDTTGVAGEEDDVLGVLAADARNLGVLNVLDGVSATSVLSEGIILVVDNTGIRIEDDVLKNGTELDSTENIGLLLGRETNALGVASSLNVEDALVAPAVLVVTDKSTLGIGREGGLASTGETEEDSHVALLTLIGRGVEGEDVVLHGHLVEEHSEDTLLHLTGILGAKDDHLLVGKVDGDGGG